MYFALTLTAALALGAEGKWTPQQVLAQGPKWVQQQGFTLPLNKLWDEKKQTGLLSNAVQLPRCSGSFVSKNGLLITNHHCVADLLQEFSTPEQNYSRDGFYAKTAAEERASASYRIQVPRAFRDVTKEVLGEVPAEIDDLSRFRLTEAAQKRLVAECEKQPGTRCTVAAFDGGLFFTLTEFEELADVRLVYAPPTGVGSFGGEVDNWMWPRHSGDFALIRAYKDGKPYQPANYFPLSKDGVKEGAAVAVLGYPGLSFRSWVAMEMDERRRDYYPRLKEIFSEWAELIEKEARRSTDAELATADDLRGLYNVIKNAEGQLAGLRRGRIIEKQRAEEDRVKLKASRDARIAHQGLEQLATRRGLTFEHDFLLDVAARGPRALRWPLLVVRRSHEGKRPDAEREPGYQERDLARLREGHERDQKRYFAPVDQRLFVAWVKRALKQHLKPVEALFAGAKDDAAIEKKVSELFAASKVFDLETRRKMFDESIEQLTARKDPLIDFALKLDAERRALRDRRDAESGLALKLRPIWRKAVIDAAGKPVAPDANSTLRVSFGRVKGYAPRDAVIMTPHTSIKGLLEKDSGQAPFDLPERVRTAAQKPGAEKVTVNFLADCDTTGGNSGSPVIDSKGRLVGVNFDRVWENVANDFGYNPDIARNVSADVRYLLWLLTEVEGASDLVSELTAAR